MNYRLYGLFSFAVILGCAAPGSAQDTKPALYTAAQAQAGQTLYATQCVACHGANLEGVVGPALTGPTFDQMAAAQKLNVQNLLDTISQTMPMTAPASLKPDQYAALVAFILQKAGYPAGSTALATGGASLAATNLGGVAGAQPVAAASSAASILASSGVYTVAQAKHGQQLYNDNCIQCHGGEMDGVEDAPPLAGALFMSKWGGLSVGAVHAFIDRNMPPGNGGALGAVSEADVVAYILQKNNFPAGDKVLPNDPTTLGTILMK